MIRLRGPKDKGALTTAVVNEGTAVVVCHDYEWLAVSDVACSGVLADKSISITREMDAATVLGVALSKFDLEGDVTQWALRQVRWRDWCRLVQTSAD